MVNTAKLKFGKGALAEALGFAPQTSILAATVYDGELVLYVEHPDLPQHDAMGSTPEVTLDDLRKLGVS